MKFVDEFRDPELARATLSAIRKEVTEPWVLMEICGGQTHSIMRYGLDQLLPAMVELVHGPGCPVCVTPLEQIDKALEIASRPEVIFASYGDMLRVPGSGKDLFSVHATGGDVRVVYSPLDAVKLAQQHSQQEVVFFAIGFETTAPANAMAVEQAHSLGLENFSVLVSHSRVPPAMHAILSSPECRVQGFLAAGHVCAVMGYWEYEPISDQYKVPIVVTGFEPLDILQGVLMAIRQLEQGRAEVENAYSRAVIYDGNQHAQQLIDRVFMVCDRKWRGIGNIPSSGWCLRPEYSRFDAELRFAVEDLAPRESQLCISGQILQGLKKPLDCPAFGLQCTPEEPLGATMVSTEGACAAYFRYGDVKAVADSSVGERR